MKVIGNNILFGPGDFSCSKIAGNYICRPSTEQAKQDVKFLQQIVLSIYATMRQAGTEVPIGLTTLKVDGTAGLITSAGVQFILGLFQRHINLPGTVAPAGELSAEEAVRYVAENARELASWMKTTVETVPGIVNPVPEKVVGYPRTTPKGAILIGLVGVIGIGLAMLTMK